MKVNSVLLYIPQKYWKFNASMEILVSEATLHSGFESLYSCSNIKLANKIR